MPDRYADYQRLRVEPREDGVFTLYLGRGETTNNVDAVFHGELGSIWDEFEKDPDVKAVVMRGPTDEGFLFGGAPTLAAELVRESAARFRMMDEHRKFLYGMTNCSKPLIAAITGPSVGEGTIIGLMADISIAGPSTVLHDRHTAVGVCAGDHSALIWPLLTSMAKAKYHLLLGEPIIGTDAERIGLVSMLVDDDQVVVKAYEIAERLASYNQLAVRWTKNTMNAWIRQNAPAMDASLAVEVLGFADEEFRRGFEAAQAKIEAEKAAAGEGEGA